MVKKLNRNYWYLFVWVSFILYASLTTRVPSGTIKIPHFDKLVHFGMYFGMAFLLIPIVKKNFTSVLIAIAFGIVMELSQFALQTGREASFYDVIANSVGALTGATFYRTIFEKTKLNTILFKN